MTSLEREDHQSRSVCNLQLLQSFFTVCFVWNVQSPDTHQSIWIKNAVQSPYVQLVSISSMAQLGPAERIMRFTHTEAQNRKNSDRWVQNTDLLKASQNQCGDSQTWNLSLHPILNPSCSESELDPSAPDQSHSTTVIWITDTESGD